MPNKDMMKRAMVIGTVDMIANDLDLNDEVFTTGEYNDIREKVQKYIELLEDLRDYLDATERQFTHRASITEALLFSPFVIFTVSIMDTKCVP